MQLDPGEVQIVKGPTLTVTDKRILCSEGEIAVNAVSAPQIEERMVQVSAAPTVIVIGAVMLLAGFLTQFPPLWIAGGAICAFGGLAKVKRRGLAVTVETGGERKPIYTAGSQEDAKLAHAAIEEALRRSVA
jgi:hypothetical protein